MDKILHHPRNNGDHCLLVFAGESNHSQGFSGGAKLISSIHGMTLFAQVAKMEEGGNEAARQKWPGA